MTLRSFRPEDAPALAALSRACAAGETDFVLNPLWETEDELFAEFDRHGIDPEEHLLVAESGDGRVLGAAGFLRGPGATAAGLVSPIVAREARGRGLGGRLLRTVLAHGSERLGIKLVTAGIGTRNHAGYALLIGLGFRPARQYFLMRCSQRPRRPPTQARGLRLDTAQAEDAEAVLAVYHACGFEARSLERMRACLADPRRLVVVARRGSEVVGFAELETHWPRRPWVAFVGVEGKMRERGLGSSLVALGLWLAFERGAESALLLLSPANRTALRAYQKVGFHRHRVVDVLEKGL